jgi:hypothetical protein
MTKWQVRFILVLLFGVWINTWVLAMYAMTQP